MMGTTPDQYWATNVQKAKAAGWPYISGIFEPDDNKVSVADAVTAWKEHMEPLAQDFKLVLPIVTNLDWLHQFFAACTGCTLTGPIGIDMYVSGDDHGIEFFKSTIEGLAATYPNNDIWIPNAGILGSQGSDDYLMKNIVPWLDQYDPVTRYAWSGPPSPTGEFWTGSELTAIGEQWATL